MVDKELLNSLSKLKTFDEKIKFLENFLTDKKAPDQEIKQLVTELKELNQIKPSVKKIKPSLEEIKPELPLPKTNKSLELTVDLLHPEEVKKEEITDYKTKPDFYNPDKKETTPYKTESKRYEEKKYKKKEQYEKA